MKSKILIALFGLLFLSFGCKDGNKSETEQEANLPVAKQNFSVELDVKVSKKDDFSLYYNDDNNMPFTGDLAVWHGVSGGNTREKIIFDVPESKLPTKIRLDFGLNKEQDNIEIYNVKVAFYGQEFNIKGADFFQYFIENKAFKTSVDPAAGTMKIGKNGDTYQTAFFDPHQKLIDEIAKITKK